jgi:stage II sporulation protein M
LRVAVISGIVAFFPGLGALLPLSIMGLNGTVIGMAPAVFEMEYSMFLIAILPHGILEIPALILASAVGVKFSVCSLKAVIGYLFASGGGSRREVFLREIKPAWHAVKLFAVIIPMLAAAAIIEVFVSTWVMEVLGI